MTTAIAKRTKDVRATLDQMKPQLELALPRHLSPDRLCRVAMTAIQQTPKLLECSKESLLGAIMTAAQLGLEPDGVLGQAYLVPFKGKVQLIPGYKGLINLARNSGEVESISAGAAREKDDFEFEFGLEPKLRHVPSHEQDRGEITHFWAAARFLNGGVHFEVMTRTEVEKIRDQSQGWRAMGKSGPWGQHFEEMGKKTAIRRLAKYLPLNVQKAAALADQFDAGRHASISDDGVFDVEYSVEEDDQGGNGSGGSALDDFASGEAADGPEDGSEGVSLTKAGVKDIRAYAKEKGVSVDELEGLLGEPLVDATFPAKDPAAAESMVRKMIDDLAAEG